MSDEKYRIIMAGIAATATVVTVGLWLWACDREQQRMIENGYEEVLEHDPYGVKWPSKRWTKRTPTLIPGQN